jgi:hypothetical protein
MIHPLPCNDLDRPLLVSLGLHHQLHPDPQVVGHYHQLEEGMIAPILLGRNGQQSFLLSIFDGILNTGLPVIVGNQRVRLPLQTGGKDPHYK